MYIPDVRRHDSALSGPRSEVPGAERRPQQQQVFPISHVTTHTPNDSISNKTHHHHFVAWIIRTISAVIFNGTSLSSPTIPLSQENSHSLGKRADDVSPNTTTSVVAGILVTAFVILVGIFLYVYRRSIRFRQQARKRRRHHRHGRRPSGVSKMSQGSDAIGSGGEGGGDGAAAPPNAAPEA
ncbi:hypothetical protein GQX73_g6916 [Xylaria multiplex]|uniref:Uncharacterized protein n=1 Tax=Xylaria multiplex TaxID=323545 RepID=A0A7C8ILH8_9PEZI|nr:hypothetical protein GQX73_g6916 [Xylaria multiplex]